MGETYLESVVFQSLKIRNVGGGVEECRWGMGRDSRKCSLFCSTVVVVVVTVVVVVVVVKPNPVLTGSK